MDLNSFISLSLITVIQIINDLTTNELFSYRAILLKYDVTLSFAFFGKHWAYGIVVNMFV